MIKFNKVNPGNSPYDKARKLNKNFADLEVELSNIINRLVPYIVKFDVLGETGGTISATYDSEAVDSGLMYSFYELSNTLELTAVPSEGKEVKQWIVNNVFIPVDAELDTVYTITELTNDMFRYLSLDEGYELEIYVEFQDVV